MVSLTEWPEVESVVREHRLELVLKNIDGKQRHPNINDEEFQNAIFSKNCMLNFLSLTACNLSQIFPSISNCSSLTKLVVDRNILKEIPDSVGSLCKLTFIDLSCNELTTLPSSFSDLIKLETIIISGNKIISSLSLLENLKNLNLSNNELHLLPSPIEKLERIKVLDLSQNPFKDGRFRKLANDKRARVSAIITYLVKNVPKALNSDGTSEAKENVSKDVAHVDLIEICIGISEYSVKRLNSVVPIRPHLVCCVVKNLDFSGDNFKKFISIQTKLHSSICGNRTVAAIGTHEMNSIQPPLTYLALPADELHVRVRSENDDLLSVYPDINDLPKLSVRRVYVS
uniref:Leucine-rich repeat-containing protein 47 n=1 Tax=Heterorhabditis bacteriophora TaxID=37862 RepID=A0A1I7XSG1_HETBA